MRRVIIAALVALVLPLTLAACDDTADKSGHHDKKATPPAATAGATAHKKEAPPHGLPTAAPAGQVALFVEWTSENSAKPVCEWAKNAKSQGCDYMQDPVHDEGGWYGEWEWVEPGKVGDTYSVTASGTGAMKTISCSIFWKGIGHSGATNGKRCGIELQLD